MFNEEWRVVCKYAPTQCSERYDFFRVLEDALEAAKTLVLLGVYVMLKTALIATRTVNAVLVSFQIL